MEHKASDNVMIDGFNESRLLQSIEDSRVVDDLLSLPTTGYGSRRIYEIVNLEVLCSPIALFGIVSNVINIAIFYRQGIRNTVSISLAGLAVSDLSCLVVVEWYNVCFNPLFASSSGIPLVPFEFQHLTAGVPHLCFTRITGWVTVYITAERCLCIVSPLKVRRLLTPTRSALIIASIYAFTALALLPEYMRLRIDSKYYPESNRTLLGLVENKNARNLIGLTSILYGVQMILIFLAVGVLTTILVIKFKLQSDWRKDSISINQLTAMSNKDKKVMSVVVTIAVVMIITYAPSVVFTAYSFVEPEFSIDGKLADIYLATASFLVLLEVVNSSYTIIVYYVMSSNFRKHFLHLFQWRNRNETSKRMKNKNEIAKTKI